MGQKTDESLKNSKLKHMEIELHKIQQRGKNIFSVIIGGKSSSLASIHIIKIPKREQKIYLRE